MQHIKLVFESLCRALIRFFDNRFIRDNDVEWYRMELIRAREETQSLYQQMLVPKTVVAQPLEDEEFKPMQSSKFPTWANKRHQLEQESYKKAQALAAEARVSLNRNKTTEELEHELLDMEEVNG